MLGAGSAILLFAIAGVVSSWTAISVLTAYQHTVRVDDRLFENVQLRIRLTDDQETGLRGYLLTHDRRFLAPYAAARRVLPSTRREALRLAADEPSILPLLRTMIRQSQAWESWSRRELQLAGQGPTARRGELARQIKGRAGFNQFRRTASRVTAALRVRRTHDYQMSTDAVRRLLIVLTGLFVLVVLLLIGIGRRTVLAITRPLAELHRAAAAIGQGAMTRPVTIAGPEEIVALGRGMETMRQELNRQYAVIERAYGALRTSQERFRTLVEGVDVGVLLVGADHTIQDANPAAAAILGYSRSDLMGTDSRDFRIIEEDGSDLPYAQRTIGGAISGGSPVRNVLMGIVRSAGDTRWVLGNAEPVLASDGTIRQVIVTLTDITDRRALEEALQATEEELRELHIGVVVFDATGRPIKSNPAASTLLGATSAPAGEQERKHAGVAVVDDLGRPFGPGALPHEITLQTGKAVKDVVVGIDRAWLSERRWLLVNVKPQLDSSGTVVGALETFTDITERMQLEEQLRHQALHDPLTDLPNRVLLLDRLEQAIGLSERSGSSVSLLLLDLNHFKEVNDTFGHQHGDLLLQEVGTRLRTLLRRSDTVARIQPVPAASVARLGGDEFAVILPGADTASARQVAERISEELARPFTVAGEHLDFGSSIGIAVYPHHGETVHLLLQHADVAMYAAKQESNGCVVYEATHDPYTAARLVRIGDLHRAVEQGGLELYYQPKADLATGTVVGVEALVRWNHPEDGFIPPPEIIELAEHTGLIRPLTEWVLQTAVRQCREWREQGLHLTVAVNVSPRSLQDPAFVETVEYALSHAGVPPSALTLEVTESAVMTDPERVAVVIRQLDRLGVSVSIDDFGTGYSSLSYLKRLAANELKIDKSFVMSLDQDDENRFIVRAAVALAHDLGLTTVAEGIESQRVWEMLVELGCDGAQGYYLGRPMPPTDFIDWLHGRPESAKPA